VTKPDERASLILGGSELLTSEEYSVEARIFSQPSAFRLRLGGRKLAGEMRAKFPPGTPFVLRIAGRPQKAGTVDGFKISQSASGTSFDLDGRDVVSRLVDWDIDKEFSLTRPTVRQVIDRALADTGLKADVRADASASRKKAVGGSVAYKVTEDRTGRWVVVEDAASDAGGTNGAIKGKIGVSYYQWLKSFLDREGIYMWGDGDGALIVAAPDGAQPPSYVLERSEAGSAGISNAELTLTVAGRHAQAVVYSREGGGKHARAQLRALVEDPEMGALGFANPLAVRDPKVRNLDQARLYGERKLATERRASFKLQYTVKGHTTRAPDGSSVVWAPDTVVDVRDKLLNVQGPHYVEGVTWRCSVSGGTSTVLDLVRVADLPRGEDEL
jgi:prophage tail gpP-like protein